MMDDVLNCIIINQCVCVSVCGWVRTCLNSDTTSQGFGTLEFMETLQVL